MSVDRLGSIYILLSFVSFYNFYNKCGNVFSHLYGKNIGVAQESEQGLAAGMDINLERTSLKVLCYIKAGFVLLILVDFHVYRYTDVDLINS